MSTTKGLMTMKGDVHNAMLVIAAVLLLVANLAVVLRLYARRLRKQKLGADDYAIMVALFFTYLTAICMWIGASPIGGLGRHGPVVIATGYPVINQRLDVTLGISWGALLTVVMTVGLTKISVVLMYRRIFGGARMNRWFNITTWLCIIFCALWTSTFFLLCLLECHPIKANWEAYGGTPEQCMDEDPMYIAECWLDVVSDVVILLIPIPSVWRLCLTLRQKIAVTGMFFLGAVTLAISATRLAVYYAITSDLLYDTVIDETWIVSPTVYWGMAQSAVGILGACLPLIKPIIDDCVLMPVWLSSALNSMTGSTFGTAKSASKSASTPATGLTVEREKSVDPHFLTELDDHGMIVVSEIHKAGEKC